MRIWIIKKKPKFTYVSSGDSELYMSKWDKAMKKLFTLVFYLQFAMMTIAFIFWVKGGTYIHWNNDIWSMLPYIILFVILMGMFMIKSVDDLLLVPDNFAFGKTLQVILLFGVFSAFIMQIYTYIYVNFFATEYGISLDVYKKSRLYNDNFGIMVAAAIPFALSQSLTTSIETLKTFSVYFFAILCFVVSLNIIGCILYAPFNPNVDFTPTNFFDKSDWFNKLVEFFKP